VSHKHDCVNEASDFDSNKDPIYIPEEENSKNTEGDNETSSISCRQTAFKCLCFKIGYNCHITSMITNVNFSAYFPALQVILIFYI
jgi:hypothetical protein